MINRTGFMKYRAEVDSASLDRWKDWSDAQYIRAMADQQEKNIGEPVAEHTARLRLIAARIDAADGGGACCGTQETCWEDRCWHRAQYCKRKRAEAEAARINEIR